MSSSPSPSVRDGDIELGTSRGVPPSPSISHASLSSSTATSSRRGLGSTPSSRRRRLGTDDGDDDDFSSGDEDSVTVSEMPDDYGDEEDDQFDEDDLYGMRSHDLQLDDVDLDATSAIARTLSLRAFASAVAAKARFLSSNSGVPSGDGGGGGGAGGAGKAGDNRRVSYFSFEPLQTTTQSEEQRDQRRQLLNFHVGVLRPLFYLSGMYSFRVPVLDKWLSVVYSVLVFLALMFRLVRDAMWTDQEFPVLGIVAAVPLRVAAVYLFVVGLRFTHSQWLEEVIATHHNFGHVLYVDEAPDSGVDAPTRARINMENEKKRDNFSRATISFFNNVAFAHLKYGMLFIFVPFVLVNMEVMFSALKDERDPTLDGPFDSSLWDLMGIGYSWFIIVSDLYLYLCPLCAFLFYSFIAQVFRGQTSLLIADFEVRHGISSAATKRNRKREAERAAALEAADKPAYHKQLQKALEEKAPEADQDKEEEQVEAAEEEARDDEPAPKRVSTKHRHMLDGTRPCQYTVDELAVKLNAVKLNRDQRKHSTRVLVTHFVLVLVLYGGGLFGLAIQFWQTRGATPQAEQFFLPILGVVIFCGMYAIHSKGYRRVQLLKRYLRSIARSPKVREWYQQTQKAPDTNERSSSVDMARSFSRTVTSTGPVNYVFSGDSPDSNPSHVRELDLKRLSQLKRKGSVRFDELWTGSTDRPGTADQPAPAPLERQGSFDGSAAELPPTARKTVPGADEHEDEISPLSVSVQPARHGTPLSGLSHSMSSRTRLLFTPEAGDNFLKSYFNAEMAEDQRRLTTAGREGHDEERGSVIVVRQPVGGQGRRKSKKAVGVESPKAADVESQKKQRKKHKKSKKKKKKRKKAKLQRGHSRRVLEERVEEERLQFEGRTRISFWSVWIEYQKLIVTAIISAGFGVGAAVERMLFRFPSCSEIEAGDLSESVEDCSEGLVVIRNLEEATAGTFIWVFFSFAYAYVTVGWKHVKQLRFFYFLAWIITGSTVFVILQRDLDSRYVAIVQGITLGYAAVYSTVMIARSMNSRKVIAPLLVSYLFLLSVAVVIRYELVPRFTDAKSDDERLSVVLIIHPLASTIAQSLAAQICLWISSVGTIDNIFVPHSITKLAFGIIGRLFLLSVDSLKAQIVTVMLFAMIEIATRISLPLRSYWGGMIMSCFNKRKAFQASEFRRSHALTAHRIYTGMVWELYSIVFAFVFALFAKPYYGIEFPQAQVVVLSLLVQAVFEAAADQQAVLLEEGFLSIDLLRHWSKYATQHLKLVPITIAITYFFAIDIIAIIKFG